MKITDKQDWSLSKHVYIYIGDLNSEQVVYYHWVFVSNTWIANFYLFGIQMVANWMVQIIWLAAMVKSTVTKCDSVLKFLPFE